MVKGSEIAQGTLEKQLASAFLLNERMTLKGKINKGENKEIRSHILQHILLQRHRGSGCTGKIQK